MARSKDFDEESSKQFYLGRRRTEIPLVRSPEAFNLRVSNPMTPNPALAERAYAPIIELGKKVADTGWAKAGEIKGSMDQQKENDLAKAENRFTQSREIDVWGFGGKFEEHYNKAANQAYEISKNEELYSKFLELEQKHYANPDAYNQEYKTFRDNWAKSLSKETKAQYLEASDRMAREGVFKRSTEARKIERAKFKVTIDNHIDNLSTQEREYALNPNHQYLRPEIERARAEQDRHLDMALENGTISAEEYGVRKRNLQQDREMNDLLPSVLETLQSIPLNASPEEYQQVIWEIARNQTQWDVETQAKFANFLNTYTTAERLARNKFLEDNVNLTERTIKHIEKYSKPPSEIDIILDRLDDEQRENITFAMEAVEEKQTFTGLSLAQQRATINELKQYGGDTTTREGRKNMYRIEKYEQIMEGKAKALQNNQAMAWAEDNGYIKPVGINFANIVDEDGNMTDEMMEFMYARNVTSDVFGTEINPLSHEGLKNQFIEQYKHAHENGYVNSFMLQAEAFANAIDPNNPNAFEDMLETLGGKENLLNINSTRTVAVANQLTKVGSHIVAERIRMGDELVATRMSKDNSTKAINQVRELIGATQPLTVSGIPNDALGEESNTIANALTGLIMVDRLNRAGQHPENFNPKDTPITSAEVEDAYKQLFGVKEVPVFHSIKAVPPVYGIDNWRQEYLNTNPQRVKEYLNGADIVADDGSKIAFNRLMTNSVPVATGEGNGNFIIMLKHGDEFVPARNSETGDIVVLNYDKIYRKSPTEEPLSRAISTDSVPLEGGLPASFEFNRDGTRYEAPTTRNGEKNTKLSNGAVWQPLHAEVPSGEFDFENFRKYTAARESGPETPKAWKVINKFGYVGRYQFGAPALIDAGFVSRDILKENKPNQALRNPKYWTGKAKSLNEFLNSKDYQNEALLTFTKMNLTTLKNKNILSDNSSAKQKYEALSYAHLNGVGSTVNFYRG